MPNPETEIISQESTAVTLPPLSKAGAFWYSIANLGYGMFFSFNNAVIPLYLHYFCKNNIILGLMGSSHSIEGIVIQPIVGSWSDKIRTKIGRRKPFMLAAIPLCSLLMLLTPVAANLPASIRLGAIAFLIFLFTVLFNVAFDPYQAMMPDITPQPQRGSVMAFWTLLGVIGQAFIVMVNFNKDEIANANMKFYIVGGVMLVTTLLTIKFVREPLISMVSTKPHSKISAEIRMALKGLRTLTQAKKGLIVYGLYGIGVGAIMPFLTLFVKHITNCTDGQAGQAFMILMISTAICVIPMGKLTDKIGSMRVLFLGIAMIAIASTICVFVSSLNSIYAVLFLAGIGNAAQSAAAYPLMTEIVPRDEIGLYTGFQTVALSVLQPLTVVGVGHLMNLGNYRSVFWVCAASMIIALLVLKSIKLNLAVHEVTVRQLELDNAV